MKESLSRYKLCFLYLTTLLYLQMLLFIVILQELEDSLCLEGKTVHWLGRAWALETEEWGSNRGSAN